MDYVAVVIAFLGEYSGILGAVASAMAIIAGVWAFIVRPFRKGKKFDLSDDTIEKIAPYPSKDGPQLTVAEFIRLRREIKSDLEAELETAKAEEKALLTARISELESQIANPQTALAEAQARINDLEALLERSGNDIGGDRIMAARAALERGDYSIADGIFAEIEARREMEVQEAARAAFGRGEIAEAEVRWGDAADHYTRAARLDPGYDTLIKAGEFLSLAGRHDDAIWHQQHLVKIARQEFGGGHAKTATALNNLAENYRSSGSYAQAEPLYREALAVFEAALGADHPNTVLVRKNLQVLLDKLGS